MKNFKPLWYFISTAAFICVTFFGHGPVLFADGSMGERVLTFLVVILLYILINFVFIGIKNRGR